MCRRLKHCGRITIIILTVINCQVFSLHTADGESEVCPRPSATESDWDTTGPSGGTMDKEPGNLLCFLLVPG